MIHDEDVGPLELDATQFGTGDPIDAAKYWFHLMRFHLMRGDDQLQACWVMESDFRLAMAQE